ncbi:DoxX family protein [Actinospongicola halichondriae]|uniref:DoxX family protein n=1 Tax=Actinospongicola halichondriae TaxID=3236844 RepID=UPI003D493ED6
MGTRHHQGGFAKGDAMNVALWIVAGLLAVGFGAGGVAMLAMSKERFRAISSAQHYVDDFDPRFIKALGALKVLAAAGLILPAIFDIATVLVPLAALGLVLVMTGASTVRIVRREWGSLLGDLGWFALAAFVAWGRFGPESFVG